MQSKKKKKKTQKEIRNAYHLYHWNHHPLHSLQVFFLTLTWLVEIFCHLPTCWTLYETQLFLVLLSFFLLLLILLVFLAKVKLYIRKGVLPERSMIGERFTLLWFLCLSSRTEDVIQTLQRDFPSYGGVIYSRCTLGYIDDRILNCVRTKDQVKWSMGSY